MRVTLVRLAAVCGAIGLSGCMIVQQPVMGFLGSEVRWGDVATGKGNASKTGKACIDTILGLIARGDASVAAAKAAGRISEVSVVDHTSRNFMGITGEYCTVVRGD